MLKYEQFNTEQKIVFDIIIDAFDAKELNFYFVHGPTDTEKTFLYQVICYYLRSEGKIVLYMAPFGITAFLLPGETTARSTFGIPVPLPENGICNVSCENDKAQLMRAVSLIIQDEMLMQHKNCFHAVDKMLRDIRKIEKPFNSIPVIYGDDFAQYLPIVEDRSCKGLERMQSNCSLTQLQQGEIL